MTSSRLLSFLLAIVLLGTSGIVLSQDAPESMVGIYAVEMRSENRCHWNYGLVEMGEVDQDIWRFEVRRSGDRSVIVVTSTGLARSVGFGSARMRGADVVITQLSIPTDGRETLVLEEVVVHAVGSNYEGYAITHPPSSFAGRSCPEGLRWSVTLRRI